MLNDGRLLLAGGCLPVTDARQGDLDNPGVLTAPAGLLAQADQPTGNGLVYPKVRQWSLPKSSSLSSAVRVHIVGAFAQAVLRTAVQAYHHQHVLCYTAFGALEHPSPKDYAYHRPCPCSSSHQVQAVATVSCQSPLSDTKAGKLVCCHDLNVLSAYSLVPQGAVERRRCWPCGGVGTACTASWRCCRRRLATAFGSCTREALCWAHLPAPGHHWRVLAVAAARPLQTCASSRATPVVLARTLTANYNMDSHGCVPRTPHSSGQRTVCARSSREQHVSAPTD